MARGRRSESLVVPRSEIVWGLLALFFPAVGRALFFRSVFPRALPLPIFFEGLFRAVFLRAAFFVRFLVIYSLPLSHSLSYSIPAISRWAADPAAAS